MREPHQTWSEALLKNKSALVLLLSILLNVFSWVTDDSTIKFTPGPRHHIRSVVSGQYYPHNDAIITYAVGIDFMGCYRFFYSARIHMPTADILFFTSRATVEGSSEMREALESFRVTPVYVDSMEFPPTMRSGNQHSQIRWVAYQIWMQAHEVAVEAGSARPYNTLLFMDTRDAVFQGDVFQGLREYNEGRPGFFAFLEGHGTIGGSEWNYMWIANCLGGEKLSLVDMYPVSCSGTVAASWKDALVFISLFCTSLWQHILINNFFLIHARSLTPARPLSLNLILFSLAHVSVETLLPRLDTTPGCLINGVDQGIFNYLVHSGS